MKNIKVFFSNFKNSLSTVVLISIPKNVIAQQAEEIVDYTMTKEEINTKITEFKTKHPKFAAVVEGISNLDLKETVKAYLGAEVLQKLFKYHAKNLVEEQIAPTQ
jgi:thiamine pyrophosphate-dependent acetolactate synthase large subunit-like protein